MLTLTKRNAVYIPTSPRPSSKIFEFFGISPSASPSSSLRVLLSGGGTGRSTPANVNDAVLSPVRAADEKGQVHTTRDRGWSHPEAYKEPKTGRRKRGCFRALVQSFGPIWFAIPLNAGLIGLLLRQILLHVLIPSDLVHTATAIGSANNTRSTGITIKDSFLRSTRPFKGQRALQTLSTVFFFIDLALFAIFSFLFVLRLIWFRRMAWREVLGLQHHGQGDPDPLGLHNPDDTSVPHDAAHHSIGYLSLWPITWLTLVAFAVSIIPEMDPSGVISVQALMYVAYITWWIGAAWTVVTTILILDVVILARLPPGSRNLNMILSPSLLFTPIALATLAIVGSLLVSDLLLPSNGPRAGLSPPGLAMIPVFIFSFCAVGAALFLGVVLYPVLLLQGLFHPGGSTIVTPSRPAGQMALALFYFIGPVSQCAAGLQLLGASLAGIPNGDQGGRGNANYGNGDAAFLTNTVPTLISVPCIILALLLYGIAVVWFLLALVVVCHAASRRELRWTPEWHGIILPLVALALSSLLFGAELDSGFFRVVACVLLVVVMIGFLVNAGFTAWFVVQGARRLGDNRRSEVGNMGDLKLV